MATPAAPPASTASSRHEAVAAETGGAPRSTRAILFLAPAFLVYGLFVLWPVVEVCRLALTQWNGYGPQTFIGLANFPKLWSDATFRISLQHSIVWEVGAIVVATLLGLLLALLARHARASGLALAALFFPVLLPATVVAAVWSLVYSPVSGPLNALLQPAGFAADWLGDPRVALPALFVAWLWSAVGVGAMVLGTAIASIGREYWEMASLEGARPIWRFVHVTLPGIRRSLIAVLLLNAALGSQVFDLVYVTTGGGPGYATMLLPIDMYGRAFGGKAGQGAAVAVVQVLLGLLFAALAVLLLGKHEESMDAGTPYAGTTQSRTATIALFAILLLFALPLLWLLPATVQSGRSFALAGTSLSPAHWTLSNVQSVLSAGMGGAVVTSFLLALAVVAGAIALGVPAAFALSALLHSGPVRAIVLGLFLIGLLQPTQVLIIPLFAMLRDLDLLDSPLGIILPEVARLLPFTVLLLWGFLAQSPREVFEAARIDGASAFQEMRSIAVPLIRPALAAAGIWAFVSSWNEYLLPTIVSQDGGIVTVPTLLASFIGKFDTQFGALAAGAVLALLPSLLIYGALGRVAGRGVSRVERGLR